MEAHGEVLVRTPADLVEEILAELAVTPLSGLQAQGDVIVMPLHMAGTIRIRAPKPVPAEGVVIVPAGRGGHEHRLMAGPEVMFGPDTRNIVHRRATVGALYVPEGSVAYLLHHDGAPVEGDHAMLAIAPGWYALRRQRESLPGNTAMRWTAVAD